MFLIKKIHYVLFGFFFLCLFSLTSCSSKDSDIISTVYVGYDFANAVIGKDSNLTTELLVKPGVDIHSFEPSGVNIRSILNSKLFIYVGGEDDSAWVEKEILPNLKESTKVINMFDCLRNKGVKLLGEETPISAEDEEEHEHEHEHDHEEAEDEYDSHVWTSPKNAIIILEAIRDALIEIDMVKDSSGNIKYPNKDKYMENTKKYVDSLTNIDSEIRNTVATARTNYMVVGDRFPLLYFVKEYGIEYDAAFSGCSSNKDASNKTILSLAKDVVDHRLSYIFVIEMTSSTVANAVKETVDSYISNKTYDGKSPEILTFYSMQNISKDDFQKGYTYLDFMNKNIESLKLALN